MNMNQVEIYKKLYLCRIAEDAIIKYYHENDMKTPMHMSYGQEHVPVGVCAVLSDTDQIFSTYRSHAAYLAKTNDIDGFFAELYGKKTGVARGKAGSMHLINVAKGHMGSSAIVASCIPVAAGVAFGNKFKQNNNKIAVFFGDGATDEGVFWETLNLASLMELPMLFVCEDNGLAVHTSLRQRKSYNILSAIDKFGINVREVNSFDAAEIYSATKQLLDSIDSTNKPGFLLAKCYRYLEHVGVNEDFNQGYRIKNLEAMDKDCVKTFRSKLELNEQEITTLEKEIEDKIETSIQKAKNDELPSVDELYDGIFV